MIASAWEFSDRCELAGAFGINMDHRLVKCFINSPIYGSAVVKHTVPVRNCRHLERGLAPAVRDAVSHSCFREVGDDSGDWKPFSALTQEWTHLHAVVHIRSLSVWCDLAELMVLGIFDNLNSVAFTTRLSRSSLLIPAEPGLNDLEAFVQDRAEGIWFVW